MAYKANQSGFTLVELMVGVVLGMLTIIVIAQVLGQSEAQRRSLASGSDADVNGSLALFTLQRDIQMAGYGLAASPTALGCTVKSNYDGTARPDITLVPALIGNGGNDGEPDSITVMQGHTSGSAIPMRIKEDKSTRFIVESTSGTSVGDQIVAVPQAWSSTQWCTLFAVTNNTASADTSLTTENLPHADTNAWNKTPAVMTYDSSSILVNIGTPTFKTYMVTGNNLQLAERDPSTGVGSGAQDLFSEIVNLQALYGKDEDSNGTVDKYDNIAPTTADGWKQVIALRIALVARNNKYEREVVTDSEPLWDVGKSIDVANEKYLADCGGSQCITLKIDHLDDWKHYRYKVYTTTVPLRNVLWNS